MDGVEQRDDGTAVLRVRVSAVPDKGKANAAVVALIAGMLGVPRSSIRLVSGETSRVKTLDVMGDGTALAAAIDGLAQPTVSFRP